MPRENRPLEPPTDADVKSAAKMLSLQPKVRISLHQAKPPENPYPDKTVQVNGYTYQIKRGVRVDVPQTVYEILVQSGDIEPLHDEDEVFVPTASAHPLSADKASSFSY